MGLCKVQKGHTYSLEEFKQVQYAQLEEVRMLTPPRASDRGLISTASDVMTHIISFKCMYICLTTVVYFSGCLHCLANSAVANYYNIVLRNQLIA